MAAETAKASDGEYEHIRALGKYQILKKLGAGGMGAVFLASDTELKRSVALKVLPKERAENPTLVRRFKAEAQAVAQLRHDNIVSIYETGEIQGFPYLALEFVDGHDLQSLIQKRGPIPPKRSLKILRQVADALQHAYEKNIVHRDIKPSNLLVQVDGTTKITDFGLARSVDETLDTSITRAGTTVGTVDYISPEQAINSKAADIRSDIYSLGCTWYHMLTGEPPFAEGTMQNKLHGHINSPPPNPRRINSNVPEGYVAVIQRMMAKRPQDRYQTPADLLRDLDQVAGAVSSRTAELFDEPTRPVTAATLDSEELPAAELPQKIKGLKPAKTSPSKSPRPRAERAADPDESSAADATAPSKINEQWRGRGRPIRKPTATRGAGASAEADDAGADEAAEGDAGVTRKSRKLPPRSQKEPGGFAIDLDFARIGLIALIVAGAAGLFWWAFSRGGSWSSGRGSAPPTVAAQPAAPQPQSPVQPAQPLNPNAPQAPTVQAVITNAAPQTQAAPPKSLLAADPLKTDRTGPLLVGADDLTDVQSPEARELVPDWVYALRNASTDAASKAVIETAPGGGGQSSLDAAIHSLAGTERLIELRGPGPFQLRPTVILGVDRLVIRAAIDSAPVILLSGTPDAARDHGYLQLTGGVLEVEGVHVVVGSYAAEKPRAVFAVEGGTIALRDCSATAAVETGPTVLARVAGSAKHPFTSRVLLERCLVRGRALTAVSARGERVDAIVAGSLLANDAGPALIAELTTPNPPIAQPAAPIEAAAAASVVNAPETDAAAGVAKPPPLAVRLLSSVIWTGATAVELRQPPSDTIRRGSLRLRRSICASTDAATATLLSLPVWPARATALSGQPRIAGLAFHADRSWLAGWPTLVQLGEVKFTAAGEWPDLFGHPLETGAHAPEAVVERASDLAHLTAALLEPVTAGVPVDVAAGSRVGSVDGLPSPPDAVIDRYLLLAGRPRLPEGFVDLPAAADVLKYDLKGLKRSLGELLSSDEVPSGSHVQLTGIGVVELPPLKLSGKSLRLEFLQAGEGGALTLRPVIKPGEMVEAWLTVDGGRLDLIGARVQASPSKDRPSPARLVLIRNADFTIRSCSFEGPPGRDDDPQGLLDWVQTTSTANRRHGYIADSHFAGTQALLTADVDARLLVVHNNLLAGRGSGITLRSSIGAAEIERTREGWVVLEHNTQLFGRQALQFAGIAAGRETPAVRVLSTACVFAPAPGIDTAVLARHPENMTSRNLFDWWEQRNGYAPALKQFRHSQTTATAAGSATPQEFSRDWIGFWGTEHVESPYLGASGVLMATVLTSLNNLAPPAVALSRSCSAAGGAPDGTAIGIRIDRVGAITRMATSLPSASPTAPTANVPPRTGNRPDF